MRRTISKLYHETAKRLEIEHLDRLCAVLKCQPGDLLEWTEDDAGAPDDKAR
ncbi:MAG: helix-turn-helix transcriptional regulator [Firmicutes bacterium]|nr:helix-turn-helix transcriptional regulator [Bacillota bacterium]